MKSYGTASKYQSVDVRMGKPTCRQRAGIRKEGTRGTETSKYPEEEKSNEMPTERASEEGRGKPVSTWLSGVEDCIWVLMVYPNYLEGRQHSVKANAG